MARTWIIGKKTPADSERLIHLEFFPKRLTNLNVAVREKFQHGLVLAPSGPHTQL